MNYEQEPLTATYIGIIAQTDTRQNLLATVIAFTEEENTHPSGITMVSHAAIKRLEIVDPEAAATENKVSVNFGIRVWNADTLEKLDEIREEAHHDPELVGPYRVLFDIEYEGKKTLEDWK